MDFCRRPLCSSFKNFQKGKLGEFYNIGSNNNFKNLEISQKILNVARKYISIGEKLKFILSKIGLAMT